MKPTCKKQTTALRFRRFCRQGYAAFRSMHRVVNIGHIATYIADKQLRKSAVAVVLGVAMLAPATTNAQGTAPDDQVLLQEVMITPPADTLFGSPEPAAVLTANDLKNASVRTVGDIIGMLPGIDIRTRGVGDAQSDLSMRGSTFDQMLLLIGGINFTDAQTGHHTMDMPIDITMVERVELLSPAQLMSRGIVAFCGAVNIVVAEEYRQRLVAELSYGSHGTANASVLAGTTMGQWAVTATGAFHRSSGYMPNTDYVHGSLYLAAAHHSATDDWNLQLGGQMKGFGSQAFYSTAYPDQYEATRTLLASASNVHRFSHRVRSESAAYYRLHTDRFELFRTGYATAPAWYTGHNYHIGTTAGVRNRATIRVGLGQVLAGAEARYEGIASNVLGLPDTTLRLPYTKSASRIGVSGFAGYAITHGIFSAEIEGICLYNSAFGLNYGGTANAVWHLGHTKVHAAVSRTYRLPTFTDLYYQGPNQQANPNLEAEHSYNAEVGATLSCGKVYATATAYYRAGHQIIDWVRANDTEMWRSLNHTVVDALGADLAATYRVGSWLDALGATYSYCYIDKSSGRYMSQYALEYLRHRAEVYATFAPLAKLRLRAGAQYRLRDGYYADAAGNAVPYGSALLLNASATYTMGHVVLYAEGFNLTATQYRDHGGVPMPGRTWLVGMRLEY